MENNFGKTVFNIALSAVVGYGIRQALNKSGKRIPRNVNANTITNSVGNAVNNFVTGFKDQMRQ